MKNVETLVSRDSRGPTLPKLTCNSKVLHEVKVYDKNGKLKKVISEERIHQRHWEMARAEAKNRAYKTSIKIPKE